MKAAIRTFPHRLLTTPTRFIVTNSDDAKNIALHDQIDAAKRVLDETPVGLALASNQTGKIDSPFRFFVVKKDFASQNGISSVILNPSYVPHDASMVKSDEGCLSFPGMHLEIARPFAIKAQFWNDEWKSYNMIIAGLAARMFQHECEHLDGETFLKHLPRIQRFQVLGRYKNAR